MAKIRSLAHNDYFERKHSLEHRGDFLFLHEKISAKNTFSRENFEILFVAILFFVVLFTAVFLIFGFLKLWILLFSMLLLFYFSSLIFKALLIIISLNKKIPSPTINDIDSIKKVDLPPYTILVPIYKEASVLPGFIKHMKQMDYPKEKLDIRLLLEEDDIETIQVAKNLKLETQFKLVIIPQVGPKTKPKALNVGIIDNDSEILTIYDAEDRPEFDQLKKVAWAFKNLPKDVVCVQAKLTFYNAEENLLTKWFYAEYHSWFNHFLPALFAKSLPIPLGGTSNHFKTSILKEIGAWDPYNVTEDADLGIRISRLGYKISMIDSLSVRNTTLDSKTNRPIIVMNTTTYEEANNVFLNWFYQRTRWIKGYLQTAIVHLRNPVQAIRDMSWRGFLSFFFFIVGTPLSHILNLFAWTTTILWLINYYVIPLGIPNFLLVGGWISLIVGNTLFILLHVFPALKSRKLKIALASLLIPIYWLMMSLATLRAFYQLILKPHYWDKTRHGLTKISFKA